ncbi:hypothetical protein AAV35_011155 [Salimicrobium jeotgali]|uniref:DinB-like domain-containing protein n=1 Tax=Salimicrobium jeotgali TaxID=1230341 RepID=K2GPK2_9BACI|nr:DUF1569 domain-containing protein [Salimicrobium jeotgali]AKG05283.1 hypothetical protein AAV35_011155 [Salimicrobium jeotgali]EKE32324.1 hypothetical protein MJ3_02757 [Salimicrobium jeotgali]MBM7695704.1 hypothetical protein [Salimicrobium jeotgali]
MNSIFEVAHADKILNRIDKLTTNSQPLWGKMNVSQMLAHCSYFQDVAMGYSTPSRSWSGIFFGRFAKPLFYNDKPLSRNMPTIPDILITSQKDFETEKENLKAKLITFQKKGPTPCTERPHPFFGKLTPEQWGKGIYKHLDHHLQQFGV